MSDIICRDCKHWGFNNGKPMDSVGNSKCLKLKYKTHACNHCRSFEANKESEVQNG